MSRRVGKSPSVCTDLPLDCGPVCRSLGLLRSLLRSCFGPTGRLKLVHNSIGGPVVTSSTSAVLLASFSSSQPLTSLIRASILNHVSRFSDGGLFAAILCLSLVEEARRSAVSGQVSIRVNQHVLGLSAAYLRGGRCAVKVPLDFSSSHGLLSLAASVLSSKPACVLSGPEVLHLSRLAVQAFLLSVPCGGAARLGRVVTVPVEGFPVLSSAVLPGLLLHGPDGLQLREAGGPLRVVLFSCSLAGDLPGLGGGTVEVHPGVDTDSQVLDELLQLCRQAVEDGVKLFVCQKVVHPVLQQHLGGRGVVVVERLGSPLMEPLIQLTGARPVASLHTPVPAQAYGQVGGLSMKSVGSRTMLHVLPAGESQICTLMLCHRSETMLNELKVSCQKAEHVLRLTLRDPCALLGGGCTETHLAAYIRQQSLSSQSPPPGCSRSDYLLAVEAFCRSLESVAAALQHDGGDSLMDLTHGHHWTAPPQGHVEGSLCGCGLLEGRPGLKWSYLHTKHPQFSPAAPGSAPPLQPRVLDSFTAKLNALEVAVETANLALDVRLIIQDTN